MKTVIAALNARFFHSSLAIRYLQKYCCAFQVEIAEYTINDNIYSIYSDLVKKDADVYGFSCYIWNIRETKQVAQMVKAALPECKIIFGGPESQDFEFVDHFIVGEGEQAFLDTLTALSKESPLPKKIAASTLLDLSDIPLPYSREDLQLLKDKLVYFETSRGCPFSCSYCLSSVAKGVRYFPMDYVKKGFQLFFDMEVPLVKLVDRTFNCEPKRAAQIMRFVADNSKRTTVHLEMAPHLITDEMLCILAEKPHLFQLEMGIQSTNPKTLKAVNRLFDLEKTAERIKAASKTGVHIHLDLIAGLPYEDIESFEKSFEYVYSLRPRMLQLGFLKVLPHTQISRTDGILHMSHAPYEVIKTPWLSPHDLFLLKDIENAVDRFYNSGAFKRSIEHLTAGSPFKAFEKLGKILAHAEKDGKVARRNLYELLYKAGGEEILEKIALDYIEHNKDKPLPEFIKRDEPADFKSRCLQFAKKHNVSLKDVRFEPIFGKIFYINYKDGTVKDVTDSF